MNNLAVIIISCDKYSDTWNPFYHFFFKYWNDCPFMIYHVSETLHYQHPKVNTIHTGRGKKWSEMLLEALNSIDQEYVLLLLDDYFLLKNVDNKNMLDCLHIIQQENAAYLRIFPCPGPTQPYKYYSGIGLIEKSDAYSISTQATIWQKKTLTDFLQPSETAWELETKGSKRASQIENVFLSVTIPPGLSRLEDGDFPYTYLCTAVVKGKWVPEALKLCAHEGIKLDLAYRKIENWYDQLYKKYYDKVPHILKHVFDYMKRFN